MANEAALKWQGPQPQQNQKENDEKKPGGGNAFEGAKKATGTIQDVVGNAKKYSIPPRR